MTDKQWSAPFRGEGKRPAGLADDAVVRARVIGTRHWQEDDAKNYSWNPKLEYQILEPTPTADRAEKLTDTQIKALWKKHGGSFHGPNVEHATIKQLAFYRFSRELAGTPQ